MVGVYREAQRIYEEAAGKAQTTSWKEFCTTQTSESIWDGIYRVIRQTTKKAEDKLLIQNGVTLNPAQCAEVFSNTFFPADTLEDDTPRHENVRQAVDAQNGIVLDASNDPPFTMGELRDVVRSFNPRKAPGPDAFTADIVQKTAEVDWDILLAVMNKCLSVGRFPGPWKSAVVVMLRKPDKSDYTNPKAYRPIGLLSTLGKVVEKLMIGGEVVYAAYSKSRTVWLCPTEKYRRCTKRFDLSHSRGDKEEKYSSARLVGY